MTYYDRRSADVLKSALLERAEEFVRWLFLNARRDGHNLLVGSLRGESGRSLSVCLAGPKVGVWKDFATDEGGDNLLQLLCAARGLDFAAACQQAHVWLGLPDLAPVASTAKGTRHDQAMPRSDPAPYQMSDAEMAHGTRMAERLITDPRACESIARRRGWRPETVRDLACEASLGLSEEGRFVFLYDTGAKERWRQNGERRIRFLFGKADSLWRGGLLPAFGNVFVTEGETDAVSLVDAGIEEDGDTLVVALPSAGTWKPWWVALLAGKDVTLCLDADPAGQSATEKIIAVLARRVARLQTLNLEALLQ